MIEHSTPIKRPFPFRGKAAFTMTETLVTFTVLALLVALLAGILTRVRTGAWRSQCASNQRQIGLALHLFALEHDGEYPQTTHSTGVRRHLSWIYTLGNYLENLDEVRVCPADPPTRRQQIIDNKGSSYILNDLVFDDLAYNGPGKLPNPANTMLLFILSEDRPATITRDHIHGTEWQEWSAALSDTEPDRHRPGTRSRDRSQGTANYLFADGRVENIHARDFKNFFLRGKNPAAIPQ